MFTNFETDMKYVALLCDSTAVEIIKGPPVRIADHLIHRSFHTLSAFNWNFSLNCR